jgi:hypothetical protein
MGKQIPIDDIFRNGLSEGQEQLNLGAWANMERMLDGKNPYAEEEQKKKRRILPFLLFFTLISGVVTAGYLAVKNNLNSNTTKETVYLNNISTNNNTDKINHNQANTATQTENKNIQTEKTNTQNNHSSLNTNASKTFNESKKSTKSNSSTQSSNVEASINTSINESNNSLTASSASTTKNTGTKKNSASKLNKKSDPKTSTEKNNVENQIASKSKTESTNQPNVNIDGISNKVDLGQKETVTKTKKEQKTYKAFKMNEHVKRNRDGSADVNFDTISITQNTLETNVQVEPKIELGYEKTNPRFVEITTEQEIAMLNQTQQEPLLESNIAPTSKAELSKTSSKAPTLTNKKSTPENEGFFDKLRKFASTSWQKMAILGPNVYNLTGPSCPGMSVGVNAALFNPSNNFGGFQAGLNNLKPIGEHFSFFTELKIFFRNNSGYTVEDAFTENKNFSKDNITMTNQNKTIYSYQIDSTVNFYNFKNFVSLELPIMFQAHYKSFTAYGGMNIAYNFRLNFKELKRNYIVNISDTVDNSFSYATRPEVGKKYSRDDFSGKLGLGYVVGASYSFNPNLYLDLRVTQNTWDNAQTISAREVSKNYFRVPSIQFSLGYRFKKFTPGN